MTEPSRYRNADDTDAGPEHLPTRHRTPRWVKVFAICLLGLILVFVILHLTGAAPDTGH